MLKVKKLTQFIDLEISVNSRQFCVCHRHLLNVIRYKDNVIRDFTPLLETDN